MNRSHAQGVAESVSVFCPGTIANVGPGFDCLGLVLDGLGDRITVRRSATGVDVIRVFGRDAPFVPLEFDKNCAGIAAAAARRDLLQEADTDASSSSQAAWGSHAVSLEIELERALPLSGGLGASAAASVGGALATALYLGHTPSANQLIDWALCGEMAVAGRHLDNIAPCVLGGLTLSFFAEDTPVVRSYPCSSRFFVSLITPKMRIETKAAREILPGQVNSKTYATGLSRALGVAMALREGDGELLAHCLEDPFAVPVRGSLIPHYVEARTTALACGALGFSISGSGPTLFAVSDSFDLANHIAERVAQIYFEMGVSTHVCSLGQQGAHRL